MPAALRTRLSDSAALTHTRVQGTAAAIEAAAAEAATAAAEAVATATAAGDEAQSAPMSAGDASRRLTGSSLNAIATPVSIDGLPGRRLEDGPATPPAPADDSAESQSEPPSAPQPTEATGEQALAAVTQPWALSLFAGGLGTSGFVNGNARTAAAFRYPRGLAL